MTEKNNAPGVLNISDPTDGRKQYDWESRYSSQARTEIKWEAVYLGGIFILAYLLMLLVWNNFTVSLLPAISPERASTFRKYAFYAVAGLLGGAAFGIKLFYRMVARGLWHQDRRIWRIKSPFLGMTLAFITGAMLESSVMKMEKMCSTPGIVSIGFLVGYCADTASAKMIDIANAIFGSKEK